MGWWRSYIKRAKTKAATAETPVAGIMPAAAALEEDKEDGLVMALEEAETEAASALEDFAPEEEVAAEAELEVMVADFLAEPDWPVEEAMTSS